MDINYAYVILSAMIPLFFAIGVKYRRYLDWLRWRREQIRNQMAIFGMTMAMWQMTTKLAEITGVEIDG